MAVKEPIYCALAFGSASIDGAGYKPCCNFQSSRDIEDCAKHLNDNQLIKVRELLKNGSWPIGCKNCKDSEDSGSASMRTIWNRELGEDLPMDTVLDPNNVRYLDLTFSNKCNSKCMTCSSSLSSLWGEEYNHIWKNQPSVTGGVSDKLDKSNNYIAVYIDDNNVDDLITKYPNVTRIAFVGGEPTIHEEGLRFCEELIRLDRAKNISISYVTNLTNLDDRLLDIWHKFKSVHISVSIDGYGKVNEYIRYPIKWKKVEEHVRTMFGYTKKYPGKYNVSLSHTVSLFNINESPILLGWWWDLCQEFNSDNDNYIFYSVFLNKVWAPEYLKTNLLSKSFRKTGLANLNSLVEKIKATSTERDHAFTSSFLDQLNILRSWLREPQVKTNAKLKRCLYFIDSSDQYRNRTINDYLPDVYKELINMKVKETLTYEGKGYDQILDIVPRHLVDSINNKKDILYPVRASTHKKQYAEGDACKNLFGIAVWWSQLVDEWPEVQEIHDIIFPEIKKHMELAEFYASDIVTINGPSRWVSPHVDTPHRFPKYNSMNENLNHDLLGIQVIIPLEHLDKDTGATGLVPDSHRKDWKIQDCYSGVYDSYFKENAVQLDMPVGSILLYNTRLLHSTMPLNLPKKRSILLINYLRSDIIDNVKKLDNVWSSNKKDL